MLRRLASQLAVYESEIFERFALLGRNKKLDYYKGLKSICASLTVSSFLVENWR